MLILSILILLLSNAITLRRDKSILYSRSTIFIFISCLFILYFVTDLQYFQKAMSIYSGLLFCKNNIFIFTFFIFILISIILLLTSFYPRNQRLNLDKPSVSQTKTPFSTFDISYLSKTGEQYKIIEYPLIILFITTGGIFLMSSDDLISIFLSIELQSYGLYLLCSIYRNSEKATNAGLTYFLLGGLSSCIILLGQSLLYIYSGNTYLDGIYIIHSIFTNQVDVYQNASNASLELEQYTLQLALIIFSTGFLFKISSAPFHFWSPDVYDAIPTIVTTFVAIIAKITILVFFIQLISYTSITSYIFTWKTNLLLSSFLSLIIGSILGLYQTRIKRLFAYSTISHLGFLLLALCINSIESIQAFYFYIIQYSITNLNAFFILISMGYCFSLSLLPLNNKKYNVNIKDNNEKDNNEKDMDLAVRPLNAEEKDENTSSALASPQNLSDSLSPIQFIAQLKGFFYVNPVLTISLGITLYSFIGIPPLIGFFAKQMVLSAALDNGYIFMTFVGILTSVIAAVYYLAIIKELFFEQRNKKAENTTQQTQKVGEQMVRENNIKDIYLSSSLTGSISILTLFILLFIFIPKEFIYLITILSY